jgi:nucleoside-diphosphate-sugar epimerase
MGPTLAMMAARARDASGARAARRIIAVSRFSAGGVERVLRNSGVETIACDLLDRAVVAKLPDAPNVVFMAGQKFGTQGAPSRTWMMNVVVPAICAERYAGARTVVFSTGNVYPLTAATGGGSRETDATAPVGEYAATCVGRERIFEHFAAASGTTVAIVRLNYAIALRYGVLTDLAQKVVRGEPVPVAMGRVNVIWQGDANRAALELLAHAASPPLVVNVTGAEALSVRDLAARLGDRLGRAPRFEGAEAKDALLSNTDRMRSLVGAPATSIDAMLDWTAEWVARGAETLGRATHFETRDGRF